MKSVRVEISTCEDKRGLIINYYCPMPDQKLYKADTLNLKIACVAGGFFVARAIIRERRSREFALSRDN